MQFGGERIRGATITSITTTTTTTTQPAFPDGLVSLISERFLGLRYQKL
ncbi:hypothetical protein [uncultured Thiodictyon sp.]|nr:hypothetical protein [uncultured Thiodictyon sp.]